MKYSEAIKAAKSNPEFARKMENFRTHIEDTHGAGSIQFSFDGNFCEAFYYSVENYLDERDGKYHTLIGGGRHTATRSLQLIRDGRTHVLPRIEHKITIRV